MTLSIWHSWLKAGRTSNFPTHSRSLERPMAPVSAALSIPHWIVFAMLQCVAAAWLRWQSTISTDLIRDLTVCIDGERRSAAGWVDQGFARRISSQPAGAAEAIKYQLEGRGDELPLVFLGRILVAHDEMPPEALDALETEAFRFSGVRALSRLLTRAC